MKFLLLLLALIALPCHAQELYQAPAGHTHWISPENRSGAPGEGGIENKGGKGHAFDFIGAGSSLVMADIHGSGVIDRIWLTVNNRSAEDLRAIRLDIYWDDARTPAVSVPLGDFFLQNAGEMVRMDTALFASAEGRSFVATQPMPFRKAARFVLRNESGKAVTLFYDIDYRTVVVPDDALYFHAWWSRNRATTPGQAFEVLPRLAGHGRFLGMSVGVQTNPVYGKSWWGEGEVRMFIDGDRDHASLVGTGTEDYIGSAWGQGAFTDRLTGSPVADEATGRWSFYRFHIPDPVVFDQGLRVTWQQIGGAPKEEVARMLADGAPVIPVSYAGAPKGFVPLLADGAPKTLDDPSLGKGGWTNFYRSDDVSAVAYFYLDRPENGLPALAPVAERTAALRTAAKP